MTTPEGDLMTRYLADYRRQSVPTDQLVRVRARLEADLTAASTAGGHGLASSLRPWWLVGVIAAGAIAGWVLPSGMPARQSEANAVARADEASVDPARGEEPDRQAARASGLQAPPSTTAPSVVHAETNAAAIEAAPHVEELARSKPSEARVSRVRESSAQADAIADPAEAPAGDSELARQLAIVKQARRELSIGRPRAALETLEGYARDFPERLFEAERLLLMAIAQCDAGVGADARVAIEELERRFPGHALLARARRVCRTSDERQSAGAATTDRGR